MIFIFFQTAYSYCDFMCQDLVDRKDTFLLKPFNRKPYSSLDFLYGIYRKTMGSKKRIFDNFWYSYFLHFKKFSREEKLVFLFFDSSFLTDDCRFHQWLTRMYPKSKQILLIMNPIQNDEFIVKKYNNLFRTIFTFDPFDAVKYQWFYFFGLMPSSWPDTPVKRKYDIAFIGHDKGRYELIKNIYLVLKEKGLKCFFHVVSDRVPIDSIDSEIIRNTRISYNDILRIDCNSNCILDIAITLDCRQGLSLRPFEAIYSNSRLITNNMYVREVQYFSNKEVIYFNDVDSLKHLDSSIFSKVFVANYEKTFDFSPNKLLELITKTEDIL